MVGNAHGQSCGYGNGDLQILCLEETSCGRNHFLHVMFARICSRNGTGIRYGF